MKFQLLIGIAGITLTLLLAGAAHAQANDLVCSQCVNTSDLANDAIGNAKLKTDAVTSEKILAGEVKTADLADKAITSAKLKAGSVTHAKLEPAVQAMLTAPQLKFASVAAYSDTELTVGGGCESNSSVTIEVPGPGKVKMDAQIVLTVTGHTNGIQEQMIAVFGAAPDECNQGPWAHLFVRAGEPTHTEALYQTVPLSRTFTVSDAGAYTYFLNGHRTDGVGYGGFFYANVQALYIPDL